MKNKFTYKSISFFLIAVLVLSMAGCSKTTEFFSYQKDDEVQVEVADKAYLAMDRIKTLNPVVSKDKDVYYVNKLLYNSLFQLDEKMLAQNDLAESFTYNNSKKRLTIRIKDYIKWSNGENLTANDVKFSIDAYKKASYSNAGIYSSQVADIDSVAVDGSSVIIKYITGKDMSIENLTFPIISKNHFKDINDAVKVNEKHIPLGTGPYTVESYNPYSEMVLRGNEFYTGVKPENTLIFKVVPKGGQTINLIEPNLITVAFSEKITRDVDFANLDTTIDSYLSNEVEWLGFNLNKVPMNNKLVRQAIATATDTKSILETGYFGNGVLCDSLYYPGYWGIKNKGSLYKFDRDAAAALLKKAGYLDADGDGVLEDKFGNKLTITILVNQNSESRITAANTLKKTLDKIKIESTIVVLDWQNYNLAVMSGGFDIYFGGGKMAENYDLRSLLKSYNGNPAGYSNPTVDQYLDLIKSGIGTEEKISTLKKIKAVLADEIPYYPLVYKTYGVITSNAFNGKVNPLFNNIYRGAEEWTYTFEVQETVEEEVANDENI